MRWTVVKRIGRIDKCAFSAGCARTVAALNRQTRLCAWFAQSYLTSRNVGSSASQATSLFPSASRAMIGAIECPSSTPSFGADKSAGPSSSSRRPQWEPGSTRSEAQALEPVPSRARARRHSSTCALGLRRSRAATSSCHCRVGRFRGRAGLDDRRRRPRRRYRSPLGWSRQAARLVSR